MNALSKTQKIIFLTILLVSAATRLVRLNYPPEPTFDERHFVTYAIKYAYHQVFFDIHPPLGKLIYSLPVFFSAEEINPKEFLFLSFNPKLRLWEHLLVNNNFGNVPYVSMRLISVFFSLLFTSSIYAFAKQLTQNTKIGLWAMFFSALENSFIVEGKYILLNEMFLGLGLWSLALFLCQSPKSYWSGILFGAALSIKLTAVVLLGPILGLMLFQKNHWPLVKQNTLKFIGLSLITLSLILLFTNNLFIKPNDRIAYLKNILIPADDPPQTPTPTGEIIEKTPWLKNFATYLATPAIETLMSFSGYTGYGSGRDSGSSKSDSSIDSPWYKWPIMKKSFYYFCQDEQNINTCKIALVGNPFVWFPSTVAVIAALLILFSGAWRKHQNKGLSLITPKSALPVLLFSYGFALLPFIILKRQTFLYHYFPAFVFAIIILAIGIDYFWSRAKNKGVYLILVVFLVCLGFALVSPYTYGWPLGFSRVISKIIW